MENQDPTFQAIRRDIEKVYSLIEGLQNKKAKFTYPINDIESQRALRDLIVLPITHSLPGTQPQTSGNFGIYFVADRDYDIISFQYRHKTKGTDGSDVTMQIERVPDGTAAGSGTSLLASGFDLKGTDNTLQEKFPASDSRLQKGESLALKLSGTPTSVVDICLSTFLKAV